MPVFQPFLFYLIFIGTSIDPDIHFLIHTNIPIFNVCLPLPNRVRSVVDIKVLISLLLNQITRDRHLLFPNIAL